MEHGQSFAIWVIAQLCKTTLAPPKAIFHHFESMVNVRLKFLLQFQARIVHNHQLLMRDGQLNNVSHCLDFFVPETQLDHLLVLESIFDILESVPNHSHRFEACYDVQSPPQIPPFFEIEYWLPIRLKTTLKFVGQK
jgi:hypothetical protein